MKPRTPDVDVVFVGALNVDHLVVVRSEPDEIIEDILAKNFCIGGEKSTSPEHIMSISQLLTGYEVVRQLSGSSFIALHALSGLGLPLKLAFVGVEGTTDLGNRAFSNWFNARQVNTRFVFEEAGMPAATCVAITYKGQRSLLTSPGANVIAGRLFEQVEGQLVEFIASARHVHVTSFFDDDTPEIVLRIVAKAKLMNAYLSVSLDPGYRWVTTKRDLIERFLAVSDVAFFNPTEFDTFFDTDSEREARLTTVLANSGSLTRVVRKDVDRIETFRSIMGRIAGFRRDHLAIPTRQIVDDTGAGDVFAAGYIGAEVARFANEHSGVALGVRMAKKKLVTLGQEGFSLFGDYLLDDSGP